MATTNYGWTELELDDEPNIGQVNVPLNQIDTSLKATADSIAASLGTQSAKINDFAANTGWSTTTTGGAPYASYWRIRNGLVEAQIVIRQATATNFTLSSASFNPVGSAGLRPPDERVVSWRTPNGQWGVGSISAGGNVWLNGVSGQIIASQTLVYIAMVPYTTP